MYLQNIRTSERSLNQEFIRDMIFIKPASVIKLTNYKRTPYSKIMMYPLKMSLRPYKLFPWRNLVMIIGYQNKCITYL